MTIFEYIRLSSEDDDLKEGEKLESNSIANQRNLINSFIRSHEEFAGAEVVEFCDDGWSGKNFERPAVKEMLEQVLQRKAQCIIVKDISRFGRDYIIAGNYISRVFPFWEYGSLLSMTGLTAAGSLMWTAWKLRSKPFCTTYTAEISPGKCVAQNGSGHNRESGWRLLRRMGI